MCPEGWVDYEENDGLPEDQEDEEPGPLEEIDDE